MVRLRVVGRFRRLFAQVVQLVAEIVKLFIPSFCGKAMKTAEALSSDCEQKRTEPEERFRSRDHFVSVFVKVITHPITLTSYSQNPFSNIIVT